MVLSPKSKAQGDCALRMPTKEPTSRIPSYCSAHYCRGNKKIKMSAPDKARSKNSDRCAAKVVYRVIIESRVKKQAWRLSCVGTGCLVHAHVVDFRFGPSGQLIKFANDTAWASAGVPAFQAEPGCCLRWPVRRWARRPVVRSAALGVPLGVAFLPPTLRFRSSQHICGHTRGPHAFDPRSAIPSNSRDAIFTEQPSDPIRLPVYLTYGDQRHSGNAAALSRAPSSLRA